MKLKDISDCHMHITEARSENARSFQLSFAHAFSIYMPISTEGL